jgi:hypothetical protein
MRPSNQPIDMEGGKSTLVLESGGDEASEATRDNIISAKAEAALVRKQDLRVLPMIFLMYFFTFLGAPSHPLSSQSPPNGEV